MCLERSEVENRSSFASLIDLVHVSRGIPTQNGRIGEEHMAQDFETVLYRKSDAIAEIRLNRPHRLNAVTEQLYQEVLQALDHAERDNAIRVVVLTGEGRAFCVGADMKEHGTRRRSKSENRRYLSLGHATCKRIRNLKKPVIAAINGYAIGGGLELAISADFVLVNESAEIGLPELSIGTYVGGGATYLLPQLVGLSKARELIFLGQRITGREAVAIGLATRAFPDAMFAEGVRDFAELLKRSAPRAMAFAKEHLNHESARTYDTSLDNELEAILACMATRDWREGIEAFAEKRAPVFRGE